MPWKDLTYSCIRHILQGPLEVGRPYSHRAKRLPSSFLNVPIEGGLFSPSPTEWLDDLWKRYVKRCKERRLLLYNEGRYIQLPYIYRGHRNYRQKVLERIDDLSSHWPSDESVLLTISVRRTGSPLDTLMFLRSHLNKFFSWLRKRKQGNRCMYIWSLEGGQSGNAHLHIALATKWVATIDSIWQWWLSQGADIERQGIDIKKRQSTGQVQDYLTKYVSKCLDDDLFTALLFLTGSRQWGGSFRLMGLSGGGGKINSNQKWDYLGCFELDFIKMMFKGLDRPPDPGIYTVKRWVWPSKDAPDMVQKDVKRNMFKDLYDLGEIPLHGMTTGMESRRHRSTLS